MPTRHDRFSLQYRLTFDAPFHCGTGLSLGLLDRVVQRSAQGDLVVPGSTMKGIIRQNCEGIVSLIARAIDAEFGAEPSSLRGSNPHDADDALRDLLDSQTLLACIFGSRARAGSVYFDDLLPSDETRSLFADATAQRAQWQTGVRTQVSLARLTGASKPGMLFTSEHGHPGMAFAGRIYGTLQDWPLPHEQGNGEDGTFALLLLLAGLYAVDRIGSNRSTGMGACRCDVTSLRVNGRTQDPADYLDQLADFPYHYAMAME